MVDLSSSHDLKLKAQGTCYRITRKAINFLNNSFVAIANKPYDYERVVEIGDELIKITPDYFLEHEIPEGIGTEASGMYFPSKVILPSFKGDLEVIKQYLKLGLGGATIKTVMLKKRDGNPKPRIKTEKERVYNESTGYVEEYESIFNRMGLPCLGAKKIKENLLQSDIFMFDRPIGISIGGDTLEEYLDVFNIMREVKVEYSGKKPHIYYEINASCPNTEKGCMLCESKGMLEKLLSELRKIDKDASFFVKLSPDLKDIRLIEIAGICMQYNLGLTLGNTHKVVFGIDPNNSKEILYCGKSGPGLKKRTLETVKLVRESGYSLPIIAVGGLSNAKDVKEAIDAGADLVGMASAVVQNMYVIPEINERLKNEESEKK